MKKKPMVYGDTEACLKGGKLLFEGMYKGIKYFVMNCRGSYPCGYVEVTGTCFDECDEFNALKKQGRKNFWKNRRRKKRDDACLALGSIHGGITYNDGWMFNEYEPELMDKRVRWFVGWDYGRHYSDKVWSPVAVGGFNGTEYTTDDVIKDCKKCIKALLDYTKKANNGQ